MKRRKISTGPMTVTAGAADFNPKLNPGKAIMISPPARGIAPHSRFQPAPDTYHHEFQADCAPGHWAPDDPIVYPGQAGASPDHTFMGATTNARSTTESLYASSTSCVTPQDKSAYWFPTMDNGDQVVTPPGRRWFITSRLSTATPPSFPSPTACASWSAAPPPPRTSSATHPGRWRAGSAVTARTTGIPDQLSLRHTADVRMQSPGCWDGVHVDLADLKSQMPGPVGNSKVYGHLVCLASRPGAVRIHRVQDGLPGLRRPVEGAAGQRAKLSLALRLLQRLGPDRAALTGAPLHQRWSAVKPAQFRSAQTPTRSHTGGELPAAAGDVVSSPGPP